MGKFFTFLAWFIGLPSLVVMFFLVKRALLEGKIDKIESQTIIVLYCLVAICVAWILR